MSLKDKVVVITGATGVLGSLAARTFAEQGASLALISTDDTKLSRLSGALGLPDERVLIGTADLRDGQAVQAVAQQVIEKFGRVDILLHLVGGWTGGKSLIEVDADDLKFMLNQHAWTSFHLAQALTPHLTANGWGRVIVVSSPLANQPSMNMGPYAIGKAAQEALILTLAEEIKDHGVTANIIQVKMIDVEGKGKGTTPLDIVSVMLYLCSDEAGKVTGARLPL